MSNFAIIQLAGKQFKVAPGDTITIDKHLDTDDKKLVVSDVLLAKTDKKTQVGTPLVSGAQVTLEVVDQGKGEKIKVMKYKSKSRYRRVQGHRQPQTVLKVTNIKA